MSSNNHRRTITVNVNYFSPQANNNKQNTDKLVLKLSWLKDKSAKYVSQKEFLTRCTENKLVPKGLELSLEPTIGNYDQKFIDDWYSNLKEFPLILMKYIAKFLGKTIEETAKSIDETQIKLKQNLDKDYYEVSHNTIQINEKATKKTLKQCKFNIYNYLKHNPKPAIKATDLQENNENWAQPSYA